MFAYSSGRNYIFLCLLSGLPVFLHFSVRLVSHCCCQEHRGLKNLWFLNLLSLHLSIRGLLSELICRVFMWQMNKFAVLKQNESFYLALKWVLVSELRFSSEGQRWLQSCSHSHTQRKTLRWTYNSSVYAYTISALCETHTHTQICYKSTLAPFKSI